MTQQKTTVKREQMFAAWCKSHSIQDVAGTCSVSRTTARKYRQLDHWEKREQNILKKARAKADSTAIYTLAGELRVIQKVIDRLTAAIEKKFENLEDIPANPLVLRDLILTKLKVLEVVEPEVQEERDERLEGFLALVMRLDDKDQQKLADGIAAEFARRKVADRESSSN